jgi:hypothetical protein
MIAAILPFMPVARAAPEHRDQVRHGGKRRSKARHQADDLGPLEAMEEQALRGADVRVSNHLLMAALAGGLPVSTTTVAVNTDQMLFPVVYRADRGQSS